MYRPDCYPANWQAIARACKERANWHCEICHVPQGTKRISRRTGVVYTVFLHAAHRKLHDTSNPQSELQALCPTCHGRQDWHLRQIAAEGALEKYKHQILLSSHR